MQAFGIYAVGLSRGRSAPRCSAISATDRPQGDADRDLVVDRPVDLRGRFRAGLRPIGIWGAVILTVVRFIQGVGIGGEWGGATLIAMEWAKPTTIAASSPPGRNGAVRPGLFFANMAVLAFSWISGDQFLTWGWRVPFWL